MVQIPKVFQSISWRLQFLYGLLLFVVLVIFGITGRSLQEANLLAGVDSGLQARAAQLSVLLNRSSFPAGNQTLPESILDFVPADPTTWRAEDQELMESFTTQMDLEGGIVHDYHIWRTSDGAELFLSDDASRLSQLAELPASEKGADVMWTEDGQRNLVRRTRAGNHIVLVSRDISRQLTALDKQSQRLFFAGALLLIGGLGMSHWFAHNALKPIDDISDAATRIASGDMGERIQTDSRTELGRLSSVLNHTFDQLEEAYERQARFTSDASHELRTPLTIILTETQTILKREREPEEYIECISICESTARSMRKLVESLLGLARFDSGQIVVDSETVDLEALVKVCAESVRPIAAEREIQIRTELEPATCEGVASRITQVVSNLLDNAIAYNEEGGTITVRLQDSPEGVRLEVEDDGIGISEVDLPHVFERFYRADNARSESGDHCGLGLAISKEIVEAHGGSIEVSSTVGKGTKFTVHFPPREALEDPFENRSAPNENA